LVLISWLSFTCAQKTKVNERIENDSVLDTLTAKGLATKGTTEKENTEQNGKSLHESNGPEIPKNALANANTERIKKQSPTMRDCDKSICGPMVSAFGPNLDVIRERMKMDMPQMNSESNARSTADVPQDRTWDLLNIGGLTNPGQPAISNNHYNQPSSGYGVPSNTYYKPPPLPSLSAYHPIHSMVAQHGIGLNGPSRIGPPVPTNGIWLTEERYRELTDIEKSCNSKNQQETKVLPAYNLNLRLQLENGSLIPVQVQPVAVNEELKSTMTSDKPEVEEPVSRNRDAMAGQSQNFNGEDLQAHLRKIQEMKDELNRLNMRAHKMLEQEEQKVKLEEMRKMNYYGRNGHVGSDNFADMRKDRYEAPYGTYYGTNYPSYLSTGFRPITSYPQNREDTEFFMHLMDQFKKMGVSNGFVPGSLPVAVAKDAEKKARSSEDLISDLVNGKNQDKKESP